MQSSCPLILRHPQRRSTWTPSSNLTYYVELQAESFEVTGHRPTVKMTIWRLLNTLFILCVGTSKTISAFRGQPVAPDILDWTIGVIWALMYVQFSILIMPFVDNQLQSVLVLST